MDIQDQTYADSREVVDGNKYHNCKFDRCGITYRGGEIPHMINCTFNDCKWHFEDAAERTLLFMNLLYHGTGEYGKEMIEKTVEAIRRPMQ